MRFGLFLEIGIYYSNANHPDEKCIEIEVNQSKPIEQRKSQSRLKGCVLPWIVV